MAAFRVNKKPVASLQDVTAGALLGGGVEALVTNPLRVVGVNMQLHGGAFLNHLTRLDMSTAMLDAPLYMLSSMQSTACVYATRHLMLKVLQSDPHKPPSWHTSLVSAGVIGVAEAFLTNPLRRALVLRQATVPRPAIVAALKTPGICRGTGLAALRNGVYLAVFFGVSQALQSRDKNGRERPLLVGALAAVAACTCSCPLNALAVQLQASRGAGLALAWRQLVAKEGPAALFRQLPATLARGVPAMTVNYTITRNSTRWLSARARDRR